MDNIEQFTGYTYINDIRKELDAKIEKRVTVSIFCWTLSGFGAILLALFASVLPQLYDNDKNVIEMDQCILMLSSQNDCIDNN